MNDWIREKGMKALSFYSEDLPIGEIDLIFDSPIPFEQLNSRAVTFELKDVRVPIVSIPDLIALKLHAGRKQDLADAEHLRLLSER